MRWLIPIILAACFALAALSRGPASSAEPGPVQLPPQARLRRPVALATIGDHLFAGNQSGSVSIIDASGPGSVVGEAEAGRSLSDLVAAPEGDVLYATDQGAGELLRLAWDGETLRTVERVVVAAYPVSVRVSPDGAFCTVASLWSRQLTVVDLGVISKSRGRPRQVKRLFVLRRRTRRRRSGLAAWRCRSVFASVTRP